MTPKWLSPTSATSGKRSDAVHIHQKPVELMERLIRISTINGLVVDPFAGSGAAGIAAARLGCPYVGAELVPEIAEIANRRIALAKGENDEVIEAINFFLRGAAEDQSAAITGALEKSHLRCVRTALSGVAA